MTQKHFAWKFLLLGFPSGNEILALGTSTTSGAAEFGFGNCSCVNRACHSDVHAKFTQNSLGTESVVFEDQLGRYMSI